MRDFAGRNRVPFRLNFRFEGIPGLSRESVERLTSVRPETIGQALRIPGMTAAAVALIAAHVAGTVRP